MGWQPILQVRFSMWYAGGMGNLDKALDRVAKVVAIVVGLLAATHYSMADLGLLGGQT